MYFRFPLCLFLASTVSAFIVLRQPAFRPLSSLHVSIDTSDIKNGLTVEIDNEPHKVISFSVMKQARGAAKMTIKFKNLTRGNTIENTYRSGEKFQTAMVERKDVVFSYEDGVSIFVFC
jgi:elongation factor P